MKRSHAVGLLLITGAVGSLAFCEDKPKAEAFNTPDACMEAGHDQAECDTAYAAAEAEHERTAPHYDALANCEQEYGPGNCTQQPSTTGHSFFLPMMLGYMMGRSVAPSPLYSSFMGGGLRSPGGMAFAPLGGGRFGAARDCRVNDCQPAGGSGTGGGSGRWWGRSSGGYSHSGTSASPTVERGGFGSLGEHFGMRGG